MNKVFFTFGLFVCVLAPCFKMAAQDHPSKSQVDIKNHGNYFSGSTAGEDNIIKVNIFSAVFLGELPIYYERAINKHFSAEIGLGPTYYSLDFLDQLLYYNAASQTVESDLSAYSTSQMGFTSKLSLRYFPTGECPEGLYLAPELRYKQYNEQINGFPVMDYNDNTKVTDNYNRTISYFDVVGVIGYDIISDNEYFTGSYDIYAGFGVRFRNYDVASEVTDPVSMGTDALFTPKSDAIPYFTIGIKYGLVLE